MDKKLVDTLYEKVITSPHGVIKRKVDLHIHTPMSRDFECGTLSVDNAFINILDQASKNEISIIAITDHNTFDGYTKMQEILSDSTNATKYKNILVLCGIEITCFSKHILAIFPDDFDKIKQDEFLRDIGIDPNAKGSEDALADTFGPSTLIEKIGKYGGFAILAHADSNKGFLQTLCGQKSGPGELSFDGKSLAKIVRNPNLLGIQCNNDINRVRLIECMNNKDYKRITNPLAFLKCSDCHGICINGNYSSTSGSSIGSAFSWIKLSEVSFEALKMALIDSEMRVFNNECDLDYAFIDGVAIKSPIFSTDDKYTAIHFNAEMNCIIGSRGTGKTTVLEIIKSVISPGSFDERTLNSIYERYSGAVVFINLKEDITAISCEPKLIHDTYSSAHDFHTTIEVFTKAKTSKTFIEGAHTTQKDFLKTFISTGYKQRELYNYGINPDKIITIVDDYLNWKKHQEYGKIIKQIKHQREELNKLLHISKKERELLDKGFIEYVTNKSLINNIIKHLSLLNKNYKGLTKLRISMVEELNGLLTGKVKITLTKKLQFFNHKQIDELSKRAKIKSGNGYESYLQYRDALNKIRDLSYFADSFDFYIMLLQEQYSKIIDTYKLNTDANHLQQIRNALNEYDIDAHITDALKLEYNINTGTGYDDDFRDNRKISMGQNAVALLLLILNASHSMGDIRPLLMDQPEDDIDNSYIYSTLVDEFRKSKQKRQMIISTHNPNIPVSSDSENILVLKHNGQHSYLFNSGGMDCTKTANAVLEIMEGGQEAIQRRIAKYNII